MVWFTYSNCTATGPGWAFPSQFFTMYVFDSGSSVNIDAEVHPGGAIEGVVVDKVGQPVPGASITLDAGYDPIIVTADSAGHFAYNGLEAVPTELDGAGTVAGASVDGSMQVPVTVGATAVITLVLGS
jgi:hypothetical protein